MDLSKMTTEELMGIANGSPQAQQPIRSLQSMSNEELIAAAGSQPVYSGSILPFSKDAAGNVRFDSNAGVLGTIKRAVTLPGDVAAGRVDPMSDEGIGRAVDLAGVATPVNPGIRAGDHAVPGALKAMVPEKPKVPTAEALKTAAGEGYDQARNMGVDYRSTAVADMATGVRSALESDGVLDNLAPKTFAILGRLQSPPAGSVAPFGHLIAARRALGHAAQDYTNPTEQLAASRAIQRLDEFLEGPDPSRVVAGPAAEASRVYRDANANYAAAKRSEKLTGVEESAELRAAAANSGRNLDNTIRSRLANLLLKPKDAGGYSDEEIAALEQVVRGTTGRNVVRAVGNLLGGGGGLGSVVAGATGGAAGGAMGGPVGAVIGAAVPAVGMASKAAANNMTRRALESVDEMTRMRSPLYEQAQQQAPMTVVSPERRAILLRILMAAQDQE